jgi:hypothetical protein
MLDEKTQMMLEAASALTAEDLEFLKSGGQPALRHAEVVRILPAAAGIVVEAECVSKKQDQTSDDEASPLAPVVIGNAEHEGRRNRKNKVVSSAKALKPVGGPSPSVQTVTGSFSRGEYERNRTRESKVSTGCLGSEREKHEWWPLGAELVARLGNEVFEATVVENASVKSGRSLVITSGPAQGKVCITPTRAAIEATEAFRTANHLGRGGGVTNGWTFWQLKK